MVKTIFCNTENKKAVYQAVIVNDSTLKFTTLRGEAPTIEEFLTALRVAGILKNALKYHKRENSYWELLIREGISGCRDYSVRYSKSSEWDFVHKKRVLHVSMAGKLNEPVNIWLGDLEVIIKQDEDWWNKLPAVASSTLEGWSCREEERVQYEGEYAGVKFPIDYGNFLHVWSNPDKYHHTKEEYEQWEEKYPIAAAYLSLLEGEYVEGKTPKVPDYSEDEEEA